MADDPTGKSQVADKNGKSRPTAFRVPFDLLQRFQALKLRDAHKRVHDSDLLLEALLLYVKLGERFGLDEDLRPICEYQKALKGGKSRSA